MNPLLPYLDPLPLIAVLRGITPEEIPAMSGALVAEGFRVLEVPLNSPRPFDSIRLLATRCGERCLVGAGTVLDVADVARVRDAGGKVIVMPHADTAVDPRGQGAGPRLRARRGDADRGVRRTGGRRGRAQDVSRRGIAAGRAQGVAGGAAARYAGVRGRRHPAGQHGPVLERRRHPVSAPVRISTHPARAPECRARGRRGLCGGISRVAGKIARRSRSTGRHACTKRDACDGGTDRR